MSKVMPELNEYAFKEITKLGPELIEKLKKKPFNVKFVTLQDQELQKMKECTQAKCFDKFKNAIGQDLGEKMIRIVEELTPKDLQ